MTEIELLVNIGILVQLVFNATLTRGGNGIGVFVNTYQDGFCAQGLTDFSETFQDTRENIIWQFETKKVSQSFFVFQLEPKYEELFGRYAKTAQWENI